MSLAMGYFILKYSFEFPSGKSFFIGKNIMVKIIFKSFLLRFQQFQICIDWIFS